MPFVRTGPVSARLACGALLALVLALRLLTPAGFMPAFDGRAVTIVACPDSPAGPAMAGHHDGNTGKSHQPCPYASASGLGGLAADGPGLPGALVVAVALLLGRAFPFLERSRAHERPPLRGPPIPA